MPARLWSRVRVIVLKCLSTRKIIEVQVEAGCKASQGKRQAGNSLAGGKCTCTEVIKYSYKYKYKQRARQAQDRDRPGRLWQGASVTKLVLE